ncbi:hypothetical protein Tco_1070566 [Tanacetum coccineum]|uniref:Uncharacterized protein n=1 Tax=Tanacetum coccineum TaxID=301880 RepID=A0ABQ5HMX0_9ASTR
MWDSSGRYAPTVVEDNATCIAQLKDRYIKEIFAKALPTATFKKLVHGIRMRRLKELNSTMADSMESGILKTVRPKATSVAARAFSLRKAELLMIARKDIQRIDKEIQEFEECIAILEKIQELNEKLLRREHGENKILN